MMMLMTRLSFLVAIRKTTKTFLKNVFYISYPFLFTYSLFFFSFSQNKVPIISYGSHRLSFDRVIHLAKKNHSY